MQRKIFQAAILSFVISLPIQSIKSQCNGTPQAGLYCDPDLPLGAPLLCNLDCLDGFTDRLPMENQDILMGQPPRLCNSGMGNQGDPNNMSWFAFIAGSETIRFMITPSNCTVENNLAGIQAGIYTRCYDWDDLYCVGDCQTGAFEIGGPGFIIGETYYFFLDGCNGSVCDYRVDVLEGEQPFQLPEITGMEPTTDLESDTICLGASMRFQLEGLTQEGIQYTYTISPATTDYPTGIHPENSRPISDWFFNQEGHFTISVQATNGCDITDVFTKEIIVARIPDVNYGTVQLCLEDLSTYRGPDGWIGNSCFFPGINSIEVTNSLGCSYFQEVNIQIIPLGPRQNVALYVCEEEFPITYHGILLTQPVQDFPLSLENAAASGCDSLVSLTITSLHVDGHIIVSDCIDEDHLHIQLVISLTHPPGLVIEQVIWRDPSGNIVDAHSPDGMTIETSLEGIFSAELQLSFQSKTCVQVIESNPIQRNALRPETPQPLIWNASFCANETQQTYRVAHMQGSNMEYSWTYPNDLFAVVDNQSDSLVVDWGSLTEGEICVIAVNSCGVSNPYCMMISRHAIPEPFIDGVDIACTDEIIIISAVGNASWVYTWDFGDGEWILPVDSTGAGPHSLRYSTSGEKLIRVSAFDSECQSGAIEGFITIMDRLEMGATECRATLESVEFIWNEVSGATGYSIEVLTGQSGIQSGNRYSVSGLNMDEEVTIRIRALSDVSCATSEPITLSCVASCEEFLFQIESPVNRMCESEETNPFALLSTEITVDHSIRFEGSGLDEQGIFNPSQLSPGIYVLRAFVVIDGCEYTDSTVIEIDENPHFTLSISQPLCPIDNSGIVIADPPFSSDQFTYLLDGVNVNEDPLILTPDNYILRATSSEGCSTDIPFSILPPDEAPVISMEGRLVIEEGEMLSILLATQPHDMPRVDRVEWFIPGIGHILCSGTLDECSTIEWLPPTGQGEICINVIFDDGCPMVVCRNFSVLRNTQLFIPNVFSPNRDGYNDFFTIGSNDPTMLIRKAVIYNRWGGVVHRMNNVQMEEELIIWDGMQGNQPASPGVYVYLIEYTNEEGHTMFVTGDLTLIR